MRVCVAGGGLAGSLLAWRLAQLPGVRVDLMTGRTGSQPAHDATAASGGAVRAYDPLPEQRELALASLAELLSSPVLRRWSSFRETGFAYLREDGPELTADLAEIDRELPGWAEIAAPAEAFGASDGGPGWAGDGAAVVVREARAGCTSPAGLRDAVLADLATRPQVQVRHAELDSLTATAAGYDATVLAVGAWTPGLLAASGLSADGYRTRSIEYTIYDAEPIRLPAFCDERTGLYGLPTADGGLLLGLPTRGWDVPPGPVRPTPSRPDPAMRMATRCFPGLKLNKARRRAGAADCYCERPVLTLREVSGPLPRLFTFTGGSGGSAKAALAASQRAAAQLAKLS